MSRVVALNAARHGSLRVLPQADGASRRFALLGMSELVLATADFPLCLAKDAETGRFNLIALFSLIEERNLFWHGGAWRATYLPRLAATAPFLLDPAGVCGLAIDEGSKAIGTLGTPLFQGGDLPSDYLVDTQRLLNDIVDDVAQTQAMVDCFAAHRLVRPLTLIFREEEGREQELAGLYTIGLEALRSLNDQAVLDLHRSDWLGAAAIISASLAQIERLRQLHNATSERQLVSYALNVEE
jgi:hypothetical protein